MVVVVMGGCWKYNMTLDGACVCVWGGGVRGPASYHTVGG